MMRSWLRLRSPWAVLIGTVLLLFGSGCWTATPDGGAARIPASFDASEFAIPNPFLIEITGSNKRWSAKYPNLAAGGESGGGVAVVGDLHIPQAARVEFLLNSRDFAYIFAIPERRIKEIAVPGLEFRMVLMPEAAGALRLVGEQICGDPHSDSSKRIVVESPDKFLKWLRQQPTTISIADKIQVSN